ncbi:MAG: hypothetical protein IPO72_11645 [Saprospiraceae bacterium]|nr:hypothetical protein [Candidatus Vicinibacter affinis]
MKNLRIIELLSKIGFEVFGLYGNKNGRIKIKNESGNQQRAAVHWGKGPQIHLHKMFAAKLNH